MVLRSLIIGAAAVTIATASGCLIVSGSSSYETGVRISQATLDQIQIGETTEAWLIATFGEPSSREQVEGSEDVCILHYHYRRHESSGGAVFLIFAGGKDHTYKSTAYFEVTGDVVTRYWIEG